MENITDPGILGLLVIIAVLAVGLFYLRGKGRQGRSSGRRPTGRR